MSLRFDSPEAIYVQQYCNKHYPSYGYDEETNETYQIPSGISEVFMQRYDRIVESLPNYFTKEKYYNFDILQQCLEGINWGKDIIETYADNKELESIRLKKPIILNKDDRMGLRKKAFWGFLVFLYHSTNSYFANRFVSYNQELEEINDFIKKNLSKLKIKLTAGRKSKEITDPLLLAGLFATFHCKDDYYKDMVIVNDVTVQDHCFTYEASLGELSPLQQKPLSVTERHKSYIIVKTIANELITDRPDKVKYTNKERLLYLCILHLCGYLLGEIEKVCHNENNATINNLLDTFEGTETVLNQSLLNF